MIDRDDFILTPGGASSKKIRCYCLTCGKDKGYLWNIKLIDRDCRQCSLSKIGLKSRGRLPWNKGIPQTEETKNKLKLYVGRSPSNKGVPATLETRIKISTSVKGIAVKDFAAFSNKEERFLYKRLNLKTQCFKKYNYTCNICKLRGIKLNAHHLNSWKFFPEERLKLDNLMCLCEKCHKSFHKECGNGIKNANTKNQMREFLSKNKEKKWTLISGCQN